MKLTKIVATIGPACESEEMIAKLIENGVNVFRFNFKHNTVEWHDSMIERVNAVAKKIGVRVGTLIDLQGPEIRINMPKDELKIKEGELLDLSQDVFDKGVRGFCLSHPEVVGHLKDGQRIVADDGKFEFVVVKKDKKVLLKSLVEGVLKTRKSLNIPGASFPFPVLIDRDFEGLKLAEKQEVDFVALSFVRYKTDLEILRKEMKKYKLNALVISKIETELALENLEEVIEASDGLMVARGDLGVEMSYEKVPYFQKKMIQKTVEKGKFVITATQMLESMIDSPHPTRAEVSDVANATYDLTDAVMLSGESAFGKHPLRAVQVMNKTIGFNETKFFNDTRIRFDLDHNSRTGLLCDAAYDLYLETVRKNVSVAGFLVYTQTGNTAKILSSFRPNVPIFSLCPNSEAADKMMVNYGIYAFTRGRKYKKFMRVTQNHVHAGASYLKERGLVKKGDNLIVLHGDKWAEVGGTSTVKLVSVA